MNIEARTIELIAASVGTRKSDINLESRLLEDLNLDSLDCVELAMDLENAFDCRIDDDRLGEAKTVREVVDLVTGIVGVPA